MKKKIFKKAMKSQKKEIKKLKSTIDWIDVSEVHEDFIQLEQGKKTEITTGVKIEPHSLFLDNPSDQMRQIHLLRSALNRFNFDIYHPFVFNPVNLDTHLMLLANQTFVEQDAIIREMLEDDMDKARGFIQNYRELEFFLMIKGKPGNKFDDRFHQLEVSLENAGLKTKQLNRIDFDNLLSYEFENDLINDFYFSRGIFETLSIDDYIADNEQEDDDE